MSVGSFKEVTLHLALWKSFTSTDLYNTNAAANKHSGKDLMICITIKLCSGWLTAAAAVKCYRYHHHHHQHDLQKHQRDSHQRHEPGRRWLSIHKSCIIYSKTICRSEVIFSRPCKIFISAIIDEPGRRWLSHRNPRYADWQYISSHYWCKTVCRLDVIFRGTSKIPISTIT